jgi:hypothetical protein
MILDCFNNYLTLIKTCNSKSIFFGIYKLLLFHINFKNFT